MLALSLQAIVICCCNMSMNSFETRWNLVARRKQSDQVCWAEAPNRTCFSISRTKLRHRADNMSVIVRYCPFPSVNSERISCSEKINFQWMICFETMKWKYIFDLSTQMTQLTGFAWSTYVMDKGVFARRSRGLRRCLPRKRLRVVSPS